MPEKGLIMKLYSPLTGDFYQNDTEEYEWNGSVADYPVLFTGKDLPYYEESIRQAIEEHNQPEGGDLMQYFDETQNPGLKGKVLSAVPSVAVRNGELAGCTTIQLKEPLNESEMAALQSYLQGQFSDGWGEGLEQQEIQTGDGVLFLHFCEDSPLHFEVEQAPQQEPEPLTLKIDLAGEDGNIFAVFTKAYHLLRENGQPDKAAEMRDRVFNSPNYEVVLGVIKGYVQLEQAPKLKKHDLELER